MKNKTVGKDAGNYADIIYCLSPDCRAVCQLSGYIAVRCQQCGNFFTNIEPDWDVGLPKPSNLVIIACSKKKSAETGAIPAHRRYTGQLFQAQLAYARTVLAAADDDIYVVSAKLGLVGINDLLPVYDLALAHLSAGGAGCGAGA